MFADVLLSGCSFGRFVDDWMLLLWISRGLGCSFCWSGGTKSPCGNVVCLYSKGARRQGAKPLIKITCWEIELGITPTLQMFAPLFTMHQLNGCPCLPQTDIGSQTQPEDVTKAVDWGCRHDMLEPEQSGCTIGLFYQHCCTSRWMQQLAIHVDFWQNQIPGGCIAIPLVIPPLEGGGDEIISP